jgi:hypothetical protein
VHRFDRFGLYLIFFEETWILLLAIVWGVILELWELLLERVIVGFLKRLVGLEGGEDLLDFCGLLF